MMEVEAAFWSQVRIYKAGIKIGTTIKGEHKEKCVKIEKRNFEMYIVFLVIYLKSESKEKTNFLTK